MEVLFYKVLLPALVSIFHLGKMFNFHLKFSLHICKFPYIIKAPSMSQEVR